MDIAEFKRRFGRKVQSYRRQRNLTQEELAERIQRSTDTISNVERGVSSTRIETAFRIAEVLGVPVVEFFDVETEVAADRERRQLIRKLLDLVATEQSDVLETVIRQAEALVQLVRERAD
jgi:transcriptional regulator with XRE-family HTH domain